MSESYRVLRLTPDLVPGAIRVLRDTFFRNENVSNCVRLLYESEEVPCDGGYKVTAASKELEDLALDVVQEGVSVAAVDGDTDQVLGVAINKIQTKPSPGEATYFEEYTKKHIKEPTAIEFMNFMIDVDARYDVFGEHDADSVLEIVYLSVLSAVKGRGIGTALVAASVDLARAMRSRNGIPGNESVDVRSEAKGFAGSAALDSAPKCACAIFTSRFSQACGRRNGFRQILEIPYAEFSHGGKTFADVLGPDHPYCTLSVKKLY